MFGVKIGDGPRVSGLAGPGAAARSSCLIDSNSDSQPAGEVVCSAIQVSLRPARRSTKAPIRVATTGMPEAMATLRCS